MKPLHEQVDTIETRDELVAFINALRDDLIANPKQWENSTLETFLAALASWTEDMDGFYVNHGREIPRTPSWKTVGEMLAAARIYE